MTLGDQGGMDTLLMYIVRQRTAVRVMKDIIIIPERWRYRHDMQGIRHIWDYDAYLEQDI